MAIDERQLSQKVEGRERAARSAATRIARLRAMALDVDTRPRLLAWARRMRRAMPGDERFGDPLSTAGATPVQVIARGVNALQPERDSVAKELGLAGLQLWQSLSEAAGRGRGDQDVALLFTDLVGFSSWALDAGDAATLELLREVGIAVETAIEDHRGRIVKRLGDGVMATFLTAQDALDAALDAQDALRGVEVAGYRPRMRAGIHWGRPRKLGGDYLGVDVNVAARVADAAKAGQVVLSDTALAQVRLDELHTTRARRLRAQGAPREMHYRVVSRG
jgi:class 3 adenylate cyclase